MSKSVISIVEDIFNKEYGQEIELYDVEYLKEGSEYYLRIYIDTKEGVTLEECQKVSRYIGKILDDLDPIQENYYLEVSSPGLDRKLTKSSHFEKNIGKKVDVKFYKAYEGKKDYEAILLGFNEGEISIQIEDREIKINQKEIAVIRLAIEF